MKVTFDLRSQVTLRLPQVAVKRRDCQFVTLRCRQCRSSRALLTENVADEFINLYVSPQVTTHKSSRLSVLFARPVVIFPSAHHRHLVSTNLYRLVTGASVCARLGTARYVMIEWLRIEAVTSRSLAQPCNHYTITLIDNISL